MRERELLPEAGLGMRSPGFKTLPPLSPERLAELVSASPDYDARFARHWFTGEYEDPALEANYRISRLRLWAPRIQLLLGTVAVSCVGILHVANGKEVSLNSQFFTLYPTIYAASKHARYLACGLMMSASLGFDRIATAYNYQCLVIMTFALSITIDTFPLLYLGALSVSTEKDVATPSASTARWLDDPTRTARASYWHATWTDFGMTLISGMSGLTPLNCLLLCATISLLYQWRLIVIWRAVVERAALSNVVVVPWECKVIILVAVFLVSSLADYQQRQDFRIKHLLQQLKDNHVKQLERDKERLVTELHRQKGQGMARTIDSTGLGSTDTAAHTQSIISSGPRSELSTCDSELLCEDLKVQILKSYEKVVAQDAENKLMKQKAAWKAEEHQRMKDLYEVTLGRNLNNANQYLSGGVAAGGLG